jgi:hypothetical protein
LFSKSSKYSSFVCPHKNFTENIGDLIQDDKQCENLPVKILEPEITVMSPPEPVITVMPPHKKDTTVIPPQGPVTNLLLPQADITSPILLIIVLIIIIVSAVLNYVLVCRKRQITQPEVATTDVDDGHDTSPPTTEDCEMPIYEDVDYYYCQIQHFIRETEEEGHYDDPTPLANVSNVGIYDVPRPIGDATNIYKDGPLYENFKPIK